MEIGRPSGELKFRKQKARGLLHRHQSCPEPCLSYAYVFLEDFLLTLFSDWNIACPVIRFQNTNAGQLHKIITSQCYLLSTHYVLSTVLSAADLTSIKHCLQIALFYWTNRQIHFNEYINCFSKSQVSSAQVLKSQVLKSQVVCGEEGVNIRGNSPQEVGMKWLLKVISIFQDEKEERRSQVEGTAGAEVWIEEEYVPLGNCDSLPWRLG